MDISCRCFQPDHYVGAKHLLHTTQGDQSKSTQTAEEPYKGLLDLTTSDREPVARVEEGGQEDTHEAR